MCYVHRQYVCSCCICQEKKIPRYSRANLMATSPIAPQLAKLNMIEQMLTKMKKSFLVSGLPTYI